LIKQGAKLVESAADILEELPHQVMANRLAADLTANATDHNNDDADDSALPMLLSAMGHDPITFDRLIERTGRVAGDLQAELLGLELEGLVARLPGGLFQRLSVR
jgi:DNA processing protein